MKYQVLKIFNLQIYDSYKSQMNNKWSSFSIPFQRKNYKAEFIFLRLAFTYCHGSTFIGKLELKQKQTQKKKLFIILANIIYARTDSFVSFQTLLQKYCFFIK